MRHPLSCRWLALFLLLLLAACDRGSTRPEVAPADPAWSSLISGHTAGLVSRKSKIRVVFVNDVVGAEKVGQSADGHLRTSPAVDGSVVFASAREIVLTPEKDLKQGIYYQVTVKPDGLAGIPETLKPYEFVVQAQKQEFEVNVAGLSADAANDKAMTLKGALVTADVEDADRMEKVLSAVFLDKTLALTWQHNADGRHHEFSVAGIERQGEVKPVVVKWNGDAIDVDNKGERQVEVPARNQFKVTQVQPVQQEREQYVQAYFSDALDAKQNLRGLVQLDNAAFTVRVEGNLLKLFPERGLEGDVVVRFDGGIRNGKGERLGEASQHTVTFASAKPQVRFVGKGVILPENKVLSVPFEAVNVRSVRVAAFRVFENNIGQFLQVNKLDGTQEIGRVGRYLWRKTIHLSSPETNRLNRYNLDVTELFQKYPGGLFRLTLQITRGDSVYTCAGQTAESAEIEAPLKSADDFAEREASSWDYAEQYYDADGSGSTWRDRDNPCTSAYYRFGQGVKDARNFLASNIGLVAKRDPRGNLMVVATDLRTARPLKGVKITAMNFQNQSIGATSTDSDGMAQFKPTGTPFYLLAEKDAEKGYLKVTQGTVLPVSHFDVGGEQVSAGIKGFIYGERGVWRPGDDIFLTFVLQDKDKTLPAGHPVTMELRNPQGQLVQTSTNAAAVDGFYRFALKTAEDAPTGDWTAKATLGGSSFSRTLKIETVMPNRLKVELDFGREGLIESGELQGRLFGQWLSGATAADLDADVKVRLSKAPTRFDRYADFTFDDPTREFSSEPETVFEGKLDAQGRAAIRHSLTPSKEAPGMLSATFTSRVFERGGAFSVNRRTVPFSPYAGYLGIKLPKGDIARNMLLTDKSHTVEIASVGVDGKPVSVKGVQVTLYKVEWRWWWDKSGDSLAEYASASHASVVKQDTIVTSNGRGTWNFEIKYPAWGRYLVRACHTDGGHCTGKVFYIDWPAWAGRAQEQAGPGASMLTFSSDKEQYNVGERAVIQLPDATQGRALVTVENGSGILEARWIEFEKDKTRFELPLTRAMSPNVYVSVTLIQPHAEKKNDRPIRLYGVIPVKVLDPETRLKPVVRAADEWAPESKVAVEVAESDGREMAYTLAVVDEGLLGLTGFKTPDLHEHFYKREALGVATWDLFDDVAGAYGGELERLLALGGSDAGDAKEQDNARRFPPVVRYFGPFRLKSRSTAKHELQLPPYVGSVRVMVVAGADGAYGSTDKSVFVRQALMMLPTVPRVVGPEEDVTVPVSLFAMDPSVRDVTLRMEGDSLFQVAGSDTVAVSFAKPEEKLGTLRLKTAARLGKGRLKFTAVSGKHRAQADVALEVRSSNPPATRYQRKALAPGETWETAVVPHGLAGTNVVSLEVSAVPPLELERRLEYLIRYPHGCVEQVTSSVFPQLYLPALVKLEDARRKEVESNVRAGIDRLRGFQVPNGAFAYWPGGFISGAQFDARNAWSTNYAGHFLVEADKLGYSVPASMLSDWARYQKSAAQGWSGGNATASVLDQAYRLYTLALANQPEVGAMNRLREAANLTSTARWMLAAAYKLAGMADAANDLVKGDRMELRDYAMPDHTFGSRLRDSAIVLNSLVILGQTDKAKPLVDEISAQLAAESWYSTQSVAYSLMAMSKFVGVGKIGDYGFERTVGGKSEKIKVTTPIHTAVLADFPLKGAAVKLRNTSDRTLFATVIARGVPRAGEDEAAASGLALDINYTDANGQAIDIGQLRQGQDLVAHVTVRNQTQQRLENLALTQMVPSGWEIHNERMENADTAGERTGTRPRRGWAAFDGSAAATAARVEYMDIRDDRVLRYFGLRPGESVQFTTRLNAAYLGRFYLPSALVEAMYDATKHARTKGRWVEVTASGR
jgi:alpha-2-macroglobulin